MSIINWWRAAFFVCLAALSNCSPYIYKDGITKFGSSVTTVISAQNTGVVQLRSDADADQAQIFTKARTSVKFSPANCTVGVDTKPSPCTIVAANDAAASSAHKAAPDLSDREQDLRSTAQKLATDQPLLDKVQAYANALVAVTNAGDQTTFTNASTALAKTVGSAAGILKKDAATEATTAATILGDIAGWFLEARRYSALKSAVVKFNDLMPDIQIVLTRALQSIQSTRLGNLNAEIALSEKALSPPKVQHLTEAQYSQEYSEYKTNLDSVNQLLATDPKATVDAMVKAHGALADALKSGQGEFSSFVAQLESFATDAENLRKAFAGASSSGNATAKAGGSGAGGSPGS